MFFSNSVSLYTIPEVNEIELNLKQRIYLKTADTKI